MFFLTLSLLLHHEINNENEKQSDIDRAYFKYLHYD